MTVKQNKDIPVLYNKKEDCCGCAACFSVCHERTISMLEDVEGFLYPTIDEKVCVRCGRCAMICPIGGKKDNDIIRCS